MPDEIIITITDITESERNREQLKTSLKEKETLLQEIHHRVKNNLAIVASLLQLQIFQSNDEKEKLRLTEAQNRVVSIGMVHELLYSSEDFTNVNLATYYEKLIFSIKNNMTKDDIAVSHSLDISVDQLNINQAIPLGLLINELVTNSFKYAFHSEKTHNHIALVVQREDEMISVTYTDNGSGFNMKDGEFSAGLGFQIMESLLEQLGAQYTYNTNNKFELTLRFQEKQRGSHSTFI